MNLLMLSGDRMVAAGRRGPFHTMLEEFSRHFERVDVLCPRVEGPVTHEVHGNVHLHPSSSRRLGHLGHLLGCARELLAQRPYGLAVAHGYGMQLNGIAAAFLQRTGGPPFVAEVFHVPGHPQGIHPAERAERLAARAFLRTLGRRAAAIRVMHRGEVPSILARWGIEASRILVLHAHYLRLDIFHPDPAEPKEQDLVFCGRLVPNKNLPLFLDAVARVRRRRPELRVRVIGEGPERARGEARVRRLGLEASVRFAGRIERDEDLARAYRRSRLLVCTSSSEGGPRVTLEAMACGVPVVSTPVGIMPEVLRDGAGGRLARAEPEAVASCIEELLDAPPERLRAMGEAAWRLVEPFEFHRILGRLAAAYGVLGEGGSVEEARRAADAVAPEPLVPAGRAPSPRPVLPVPPSPAAHAPPPHAAPADREDET